MSSPSEVEWRVTSRCAGHPPRHLSTHVRSISASSTRGEEHPVPYSTTSHPKVPAGSRLKRFASVTGYPADRTAQILDKICRELVGDA
jgi:hypothetical protein